MIMGDAEEVVTCTVVDPETGEKQRLVNFEVQTKIETLGLTYRLFLCLEINTSASDGFCKGGWSHHSVIKIAANCLIIRYVHSITCNLDANTLFFGSSCRSVQR